MAQIVIMPRQGNTVESCVIVAWKKKEGDQVKVDTPLCEVETDKAVFEVPAGAEGTLLKILHEAGDDVPVLQPIAVIGTAGEDWKAALTTGDDKQAQAGNTKAEPASGEPAQATEPAAGAAQVVESSSGKAQVVESASSVAQTALPASGAAAKGSAPASPRSRNLAARAALDLQAVAGSGPGGRIIERDVQAVLEGQRPMTAAARAALSGEGAGAAYGERSGGPPGGPGARLPETGSGIGGRLRLADLGAAPAPQEPESSQKSQGKIAAGATETAGGAALAAEEKTEIPIKGIRKLIADRMLQSLTSSAQFTLNSHARADRLQDLRQRFKASSPDLGLSGITINDMVLFAVSRLLPLYPFINANKVADRIITYRAVHLGIAVDTPRGLMVPVIRDADRLNLAQISAEAKRLATACQQGTINPDELAGSTFTVTNLGALGIESFTPVINIPEVAILGVCGIELKPILSESSADTRSAGEVTFVPHIGLSLTIDHQAVDGAPAARFLKALCEMIGQIDLWLAR